jgi:hypothetical protein
MYSLAENFACAKKTDVDIAALRALLRLTLFLLCNAGTKALENEKLRNFKIADIGIAFLKHANFINFRTFQGSPCAKKRRGAGRRFHVIASYFHGFHQTK